ncbi:MAG: arabinan endo-1,5-alpha-L-arabinosidase [Prevotella sp.]|nr:arabinan endo-1,5-alpha-L-arabinosidase [Prevotella sp.]
MKRHIYRLFTLCVIGMMTTACSDIVTDEHTTPLTVTTPTVARVTSTTALLTAEATGSALTSRGFCYSTSANPTIDDLHATASSRTMSVTLAGLQPSTTYHVRTFAKTESSIAYSDNITFSTPAQSASDLDNWQAPAYVDDYRDIAGWDTRAQWNLANVHDPTVMKADDGYYYMYQTDAGYGNPQSGHGHFHARRSMDLVNWEYLGATMQSLPAWVEPKLNEIRTAMGLGASTADFSKCGFWAPCARKVRSGLYRMYYAITIDGYIDGDNSWGERAFIGMMETTDPASNKWEDKGFVITNYSDKELNYHVSPTAWQQCYYKFNAIDPCFIITPEGQHWLVYGSWNSGFAAVQLNAETGKTVVDPLPNPWGAENEAAYGKQIWTRKAGDRWQASEAPEVVYHDGYYYLFMAYDALEVPYNTRVARSATIDGNYTFDADDAPVLTHPYKFSGDQGWVGISHCAVFDDGNGNWFYASQQRFPETAGGNAPNAVMLAGVRSIQWLSNGWPVVMPERYAAVPQISISEAELVGTWEHIDLGYSYGNMKESDEMTLAADGSITSGVWAGGKWSFNASSNTLTANGVELKVQRECDWEASPRKHTIVYSGINGAKSYWGKKK